MANNIRDWMAPAAWFIAGVFATGSFWYFLSKDNIYGTVLSGVGAVLFAGLAVHLHKRNDRAQHNAHHIEQLGTYLFEAQGLQARLNENPLPIVDHNAWVARVGAYLRGNMGQAYEVRFSDFSGMVFHGDGTEQSQMSRSIEGRSRRLNEFMAELGH